MRSNTERLSPNTEIISGKECAAPAQFALVFAVRLEAGEADEIARRQMRQAGEVKGAHGEAKFPAGEQFAREPGPAVFRHLVGADGFIGNVRCGLNRLAGDRGGDFRRLRQTRQRKTPTAASNDATKHPKQ